MAEGFEPSHGRINNAVPYQLGYATKKLVAGAGVDKISDCQLPIADLGRLFAVNSSCPQKPIGSWQSEIGNVLAAATRLELVSSRLQDERSEAN